MLMLGLLLAERAAAQEEMFTRAVKLGDQINSEAEEINPRITEDGKTLYFTRVFSQQNKGGKLGGQDIWYSEKETDWTKPRNLKPLNNGDNNAVIGVNHTSDKLYLINNYTAHARRSLGVVAVEKKADKWGDFQELPVHVQVANDHYGFYITPEEDVLLISMMGEESLGEEDLYICVKEGDTWTKPQHLGSAVNSSGFEISPFLSADKQTLYFSSNGFGGFGDADIFVSHRQGTGWTEWSAPKNLGDAVNSAGFDAYFMMAPDGNTYFSSNRDGGLSDIYRSQRIVKDEAEAPQEEVVAVAEEEEKEEPAPVVLPVPDKLILYFGFESTELSSDAKQKLDQLAATLSGRSDLKLTVTGHTDVQGDETYNTHISTLRAENVKKYLEGKQVKPVSSQGVGESQLASKGLRISDHKLNRRVEISFHKK